MDQEAIYQLVQYVQRSQGISALEDAIVEVAKLVGLSDDEVSDFYYNELLYQNEAQLQYIRKQQICAIEKGESPDDVFSLLRFLKDEEIHNDVFAYIESIAGFNKYRKYKAAAQHFGISISEARQKWAEGFFHIPLVRGIAKKKNIEL